ncbi:MAG: 23S rRNA (pseudouridine(1915)-N(3))-methyltransferase RlmH [Thermanaeromonas sp.]|uniref:23S rRNA (pseudouridine(1915)-N(3))-methyltransferase RlmH n=1 Tax=Thermanaeromonas sp. TaxID=2003697 RepID=UPI002439A559|nr:23S rRNA (pseudouridine(1915)-N(3))-methyltransferase RlmH [Thermanaeromonas sp.]MCG0277376.1 23S rRNA (pseudouridine(1915)-N(3))-methyltransferase RlmH [Thermanaeromonas sp.]
MEVYLIAVGKVREKFIAAGIEEYSRRLKPYLKLKIREALEEKIPHHPSPGQVERILAKEGRSILELLPPSSYVVAMDKEGEMLSSEELAKWLEDLAFRGHSQIAFIIGGTLGLSPEVLARSHFRLSFSRLTFPHQLMRVLLLEQLYRACKIQRGEPYHW